MFELAAFRKANPTGPISLLPLFLLGLVAVCNTWPWFFCAATLVLEHVVISTATESGRGGARWLYILGVFLFPPLVAMVHGCRKKYREKHQLVRDMRSFDLDELHCENDFDRDFILGAVEKWYGSREAFTGLVRGSLCEELLNLLPSPHLPFCYAALLATSLASFFLESAASLHLSGADSSALAVYVLSWGSFFLCAVPVAFNLTFFMADRFAAPSACLLDWARTLFCTMVVLAWDLVSMALAILTAWLGSVWYSLACFLVHLVIIFWVFWPSRTGSPGKNQSPPSLAFNLR